MACKGSGVQIPSAPLLIMKKFLNETKELLLSQGLVAILAIIPCEKNSSLVSIKNVFMISSGAEGI